MKRKIHNSNHIQIEVVAQLSTSQEEKLKKLQKSLFPSVDEEEVQNDFYHPEIAHVFAYDGERLIGWVGIHITKQVYKGKKITFGGYGIGVDPKYRRQGIASKMSKKAIEYLRNQKVDVGFLSVDLENKASIKLHQKFGFVVLKQKFSWKNSLGHVDADFGGMIAPICSEELFNLVVNSKETVFIGNGYW